MSTSQAEYHRAAAVNAARDLVKKARTERAMRSGDDPERQFYLGVEAAAEEVIHPELAVSRADGWLDHEADRFRNGYVQTADVFATAMSRTEFPRRLPLPTPTT